MKPRPGIVSIEDVQRGLVASVLVAITVCVVYTVVDFGYTTVRQGLVRTLAELWKRLGTTMENLSEPIEKLITESDNLGSVRLFDKIPWPTNVSFRRTQDGRFLSAAVAGVNLENLKSLVLTLPD